jgi:hypothetical protein
MSQRSALLRLQRHLLLRRINQYPDAAALAKRLGVEELLPDYVGDRLTPELISDLNELAKPADEPVEASVDPADSSRVPAGSADDAAPSDEDDRPLPVPPVEKLQVLFALSAATDGRLGALMDDARSAVDELANGLLEADARSPDAGASMRQIIDEMDAAHGFIRVDGFTEDQQVLRMTSGPTPPRAASYDDDTIGQVVNRIADAKSWARPKLDPTLAAHPVVHVEARIYRAMVRGHAEFPVHIRTTIRFGAQRLANFKRFDRVLQPGQWPTYNAFWQSMKDTPIDVPQPRNNAAPDALAKVRDAARVLRTKTGELTPQWGLVGMFAEKVGFSPGADLYPKTYLFFVDRKPGLYLVNRKPASRQVLSYTLLERSECDLGVDDGCIQVAFEDDRIEVITTKSLYISGEGDDAEASGILAYMAVYLGWGAQTLLLVTNAAKK